MPNDSPAAPEATITLNAPTPSAELIAAALKEATVTDANGRTIKLRKPGVLAQYRLIEALGESAKNQVYVGMVLPIIYVGEIDGDPIMSPTTKPQVEALIQRLDEVGLEAVMKGVTDKFSNAGAAIDQAALKN